MDIPSVSASAALPCKTSAPCTRFSVPTTSPSLLAYGWRSIRRLFECFNMAARGTLIGNQLAHCAEARHPADRYREHSSCTNDMVQGKADNSGKSLMGHSLR